MGEVSGFLGFKVEREGGTWGKEINVNKELFSF